MKGAYLLGIQNEVALALRVGRLGCQLFPPGEYVYVGSAWSGIAPRLLRHARRHVGAVHPLWAPLAARFPAQRGQKQALFWHIDHLLEAPRVQLVAAWWQHGAQEEDWLKRLLAAGARAHPPGFGASDRRGAGHLLRFPHHRVTSLFPEAESVSVR